MTARGFNDPETYAILGAALAVHTELGPGFARAVYVSALARELRRRAVPFDQDIALPVVYRGARLPVPHRVDFICADAVVVEVRAHARCEPADLAYALRSLRTAGLHRGVLLHFGGDSLAHRRVVLGYTDRQVEGGGSASAPTADRSRCARRARPGGEGPGGLPRPH